MLLNDAQKAVPGFLLITTVVALYVLLSPVATDDWVINPLTGLTAAAFCIMAGARIALGAPNRTARRIWIGLIAVFCTVGAAQFIEPYSQTLQETFGIDDVADCVLLVVSPITLWMIAKFDPPPIFARNLFLFGFLMQTVATLLDVFNATLQLHWHHDVVFIDVITDFGQFAALQIYLFSVALFLVSLHYHQRARAGGLRQLGALSRYLLVRLNLIGRPCDPRVAGRWTGYRSGLWLLRLVTWMPAAAHLVRARHGKSILRQLADIVALTWHHGLDAKAYYSLGLYRQPGADRVGAYLTCFETNNGFFAAIDELLMPPRNQASIDFADRQAMTDFCRRHRLASAETLMVSEQGTLNHVHASTPDRHPQDLVALPRYASGTDEPPTDNIILQDFGHRRYRLDGGDILSDRDLLRWFRRASASRPWLMRRQHHHPALSDLAGPDAQVIVRVVTCRTLQHRLLVTHGMLCLIGRAEEEHWAPVLELGAPIDLERGQLGSLIGMSPSFALTRLDRHPCSEVAIVGRFVPFWGEIKALVLAAHGHCEDRFVIGWDIACALDGPRVLGATDLPDVEFLQAVHDQAIGDSPLGPPLLDYLQMLNARSPIG
ncbi:MAG: sugar-transfer associated ATP-grasp domain-containing protein [Dongiaceae bacterium]